MAGNAIVLVCIVIEDCLKFMKQSRDVIYYKILRIYFRYPWNILSVVGKYGAHAESHYTVIWLYCALKIFRTSLFHAVLILYAPDIIYETCESFIVEKYSCV